MYFSKASAKLAVFNKGQPWFSYNIMYWETFHLKIQTLLILDGLDCILELPERPGTILIFGNTIILMWLLQNSGTF